MLRRDYNTDRVQTAGTLGWQVTNQSVNVGINFSNANKSVPLSTSTIVQSYLTAVSASCGVALGLNALVPRLKSLSPNALGKSKKAATLAVGETALSRVLNATPIMVLPPLILVRLQKTEWLKQRPRMVTPVNLGESMCKYL